MLRHTLHDERTEYLPKSHNPVFIGVPNLLLIPLLAGERE
jgi:hypothetical protein